MQTSRVLIWFSAYLVVVRIQETTSQPLPDKSANSSESLIMNSDTNTDASQPPMTANSVGQSSANDIFSVTSKAFLSDDLPSSSILLVNSHVHLLASSSSSSSTMPVSFSSLIQSTTNEFISDQLTTQQSYTTQHSSVSMIAESLSDIPTFSTSRHLSIYSTNQSFYTFIEYQQLPSPTETFSSFIELMSSTSDKESSSLESQHSFLLLSNDDTLQHSALTTHLAHSFIDQRSALSAISLFNFINESSHSTTISHYTSHEIKAAAPIITSFDNITLETPVIQQTQMYSCSGINTCTQNGSTILSSDLLQKQTRSPVQVVISDVLLEPTRSHVQIDSSDLLLETTRRIPVTLSFHSVANLISSESSLVLTEFMTSPILTSFPISLEIIPTLATVSSHSTSDVMYSESSMTKELTTAQILIKSFHQMQGRFKLFSNSQYLDTSTINIFVSNTAPTTTITPPASRVMSIFDSVYETNQTFTNLTYTKAIIHLLKENIELFVFLMVVGYIVLNILVFGLIAFAHQKGLRTWSPRLASQDAYANLEKSPLSFERKARGIGRRVPDADISNNKQQEVETSLSQVVCSSAAANLTSVNGNISSSQESTADTKNRLQIDEQTLIGQTNKAFESEDTYYANAIVPIDELDDAPPRAIFPWIENAADTKL